MSHLANRALGAGLIALLLSAALVAHATEGGMAVTGAQTEYTPLLTYDPGGALIRADLRLSSRLEMVDAIPADIDGARLDPTLAANMLARVGLRFDSRRSMAPVGLGVRFELDAISGVLTDAPTLFGVGLPNGEGTENVIRHASLRFSAGRYLHVLGGLTTSDWGMGLIANEGTRGWEPGNAVFNDPRQGDRVLRAMLATGPVTDANMTIALGYDWVQDDDIRQDGDKARQAVGAIRFGGDGPYTGGFYVAWRTQDARSGGGAGGEAPLATDGGSTLDAVAVDATVAAEFELSDSLKLKLETEVAFITGETTLAPSTDYPTHDILQLGAALRASLTARTAGAVLDLVYASGDQNLDDGTQNGFKADPNYQLGFLTWRYLMATQSGRAPYTASNPELSGRPSEDLDRFPTRQSMTNTISLFPRGWWRPVDGLEIYGGPLIALSEVPLVDPLQTRLAGGSPRNAAGGAPGTLLGAEIDLGIRYRALFHGTELTLALEGGVLLPGSAFQDAAGETPDPIFGGRFMLEYRL